jgi:integration host factor subunit beta
VVKSELAERLAERYRFHNRRDAERVVNTVLDTITRALVRGGRVELRGFGSFSVKIRAAHLGRNPRQGTEVDVGERRLPRFRCGKELQERLNPAREKTA